MLLSWAKRQNVGSLLFFSCLQILNAWIVLIHQETDVCPNVPPQLLADWWQNQWEKPKSNERVSIPSDKDVSSNRRMRFYGRRKKNEKKHETLFVVNEDEIHIVL